jgi:hypothetical protein
MKKAIFSLFAAILASVGLLTAQVPAAPASPGYQPKFAGDKAHSEPEAGALGYMRTVVSAQKVYKKKHGIYAISLPALVGSGSFTRRMVLPNRGDYTVAFKSKPEGYSLALSPNQFDAQHRAFYVDETGIFRAEESQPASAGSPPLK